MGDARHGVAGGVIAAHDQQDQVAHEFLRAHLVHRIGMDHHRDEVALRRLAHPVHPQRLEILRHLAQDFPARIVQFTGQAQFHVASPVRPEGQEAAVFPRKAEQDCQHARGQFDRNLVDPVKLLAERQRIERCGRAGAHFLGHLLDLAGGKGRCNRAALAGMFGPVHGNEHGQAALCQLFFGHVLGRFADRDAAVLPRRGIEFRQGLDMLDRLGADDVPVRPIGRFGHVIDWLLRPHFGKDRLPAVFDIDVGARHVPRVGVPGQFLAMLFQPAFKRLGSRGRRAVDELFRTGCLRGHLLSPIRASC